MRSSMHKCMHNIVAGALALAVLFEPLAGQIRTWEPVTAERLKHPEDGNWLMIRRTYDGWGYSPLEQISTANVAQLKPVWVFSTGETRGHESAAVVNNGVMFVTTPMNQVIAIDARTGDLLAYRRPRPEKAVVGPETNRGVALYGDKVYFAAGEAVLEALDATTGKEVWTTPVADNSAACYITLAPLIAGGAVMVGASGGEFGIRGFVAAFDPEIGKELWRTHTVPAPGEPGSETWPKGDEWKTGGAPVWVTGNYDPDTNLAYSGPVTAAPPSATIGRAITFTPPPPSPSMLQRARSKATSNTIRTIRGTMTRSRRLSSSITSAAAAQ